MDRRELVILSSSPLRSSAVAPQSPPPSNQRRAKMLTLSSPSPPPLEIPLKRPGGTLKTGSRAAPLPEGAIAGFASAASLVRDQHLSLQQDDVEEPQPPKPRKKSRKSAEKNISEPPERAKPPDPSKPAESLVPDAPAPPKPKRQRKPKAVTTADPEKTIEDKPKASKTSKPKVSSYFSQSTESLVETEQAGVDKKPSKPRKPRAKKENVQKTEAQSTLGKGKITKPKGALGDTKNIDVEKPKAKKRSTGKVSSHFGDGNAKEGDNTAISRAEPESQRAAADQKVKDIWEVPASPPKTAGRGRAPAREFITIPDSEEEEDLSLEPAISRRRDWTPVKDTAPVQHGHSDVENDPGAIENERPSSIILSAFAYSQPTSGITPRSPVREGLMKRRRIELVEVPGNQSGDSSRNTSPEKKAPKKKARTITDLVTAQYQPPAPADTTPNPEATDFFHTRTTKVPLNDTTEQGPSQPRPKPTRKRTSREGSKKAETKSRKATAKATAKAKLAANKLLSPASAALRLHAQDILFGTSSQLAREESPTFIRQIQQALRESEADAEGLPGLKGRDDRPSGLWAAAARDLDDSLLEKEDAVFAPNDYYIPTSTAIPLMTDVVPRKNIQDSPDDSKEEMTDTTSETTGFAAKDSEPHDHMLDENPKSPTTGGAEDSFADIDDFAEDESSPPPTPPSEPSLTTHHVWGLETNDDCTPDETPLNTNADHDMKDCTMNQPASVTSPIKEDSFADIDEFTLNDGGSPPPTQPASVLGSREDSFADINDIALSDGDSRPPPQPAPVSDSIKEDSFADIDDFALTDRDHPPPAQLSPPSFGPHPPGTESNTKTATPSLPHDLSFTDIDHYVNTASARHSQESSFDDIDDVLTDPEPAPPTRTPPASKSKFKAPSPLPPTAPSAGSPSRRKGRPPRQLSAIPSSPNAKSKPKPRGPSKPPMNSAPHASTPPLRTTPKKIISAHKFSHIDEIQDSEEDDSLLLSPTPPRPSQSRFQSTAPPKLDLRPTSVPESSLPPPVPPFPAPAPTPAEPQPPVPIRKVPISHLEWTTIKSTVFSQISTAVRAPPPSSHHPSPSKRELTWHEKILLFDPLVLEDFTEWLKKNANVKLWRRARAYEVKEWNKLKKAEERARKKAEKEAEKERKAAERAAKKASKGKGKGKVVKDESEDVLPTVSGSAAVVLTKGIEAGVAKVEEGEYGDEVELVDVVPMELQSWMVRDWCQEMSICCVSKEKSGWGFHGGKAMY